MTKIRSILLPCLFLAAACTGGGGEGGGFGNDFDGDFTGGFGSGGDSRGQYANLEDAITDLAEAVCTSLVDCGGEGEDFPSFGECVVSLTEEICGAGACDGPALGSRADYQDCIDAVNSLGCNLDDEPAACAGLVPDTAEDDDIATPSPDVPPSGV